MPKLWLALFIGYNGAPFSGMQMQIESHVATIEGLLVDKLYAAGLLSTNNHTQLEKQDRWSRAARTDKGVHAVLNCISCLFNVDNKYFDEDRTLIKNKLHLQFQELFEGTGLVYHCFKRVTTRFQIRHMVKSRHYCYVCPKMLFLPCDKQTAPQPTQPTKPRTQPQIVEIEQNLKAEQKVEGQPSPLQTLVNASSIAQEQMKLLQKVNECCAMFLGTHNFHNYSKNLKAKDPQAQRYILKFSAQNLNEDYLVFNIVGQSFIYHQIRKIIGCIIMIFVNNYPTNYVTNTFFRNQISMPLSPAEGLYLNSLDLGRYNLKKDIPEPLTFDNLPTIPALKQQINDHIVARHHSVWQQWVLQLRASIYHGIEYVPEQDNEEIMHDD